MDCRCRGVNCEGCYGSGTQAFAPQCSGTQVKFLGHGTGQNLCDRRGTYTSRLLTHEKGIGKSALENQSEFTYRHIQNRLFPRIVTFPKHISNVRANSGFLGYITPRTYRGRAPRHPTLYALAVACCVEQHVRLLWLASFPVELLASTRKPITTASPPPGRGLEATVVAPAPPRDLRHSACAGGGSRN